MKFKYIKKLIAPSLLTVFVLRFAEISFLADRGTPHYISGDGKHYVFWAIYFIFAALIFTAYFFLPKAACGIGYLRRTRSDLRIFILPALLYICDCIVNIISYGGEFPFKIVCAVFEGFAGVGLLLFSLFYETVKFRNVFSKIATAAIPIYFTLRLFLINLVNYGFISKPYDTFEILKTAFLALSAAQLSYMTVSKVSRRKFSVTVSLALLFTVIRTSDVLYALLNGTATDASISYLTQVADILCVISLIVVNTAVYKRRKRGGERK